MFKLGGDTLAKVIDFCWGLGTQMTREFFYLIRCYVIWVVSASSLLDTCALRYLALTCLNYFSGLCSLNPTILP